MNQNWILVHKMGLVLSDKFLKKTIGCLELEIFDAKIEVYST